MRVPMIAGNWKMHTTVEEAIELVTKMRYDLDRINNVDKVICPPFISLDALKTRLEGSTIKLGAQDVHYEEKGAFTGEISPQMVADLCDYVIVGHSERRQYFNETIEIVDKKVKAAVKVGLKPILCIGESPEENKAGQTEEVLTKQLSSSSLRLYLIGGMVIAYEPIWAIGTGQAATGEQANETIGFIRGYIAEEQGQNFAQEVRILYGGSVTAENIAEFVRQPEIDGALVGGASLKASEFLKIVEQTAEIKGAK
jgi:triosephosphate isomerase